MYPKQCLNRMRAETISSKRSKSATRAAKTARVEARTSPEKKALYQSAAELRGQTFTEFVERSLDEAAERAHREHESVQLSERDAKRFVAALLGDAKANVRLREAAKRYRRLTAT